MKVVIIEGLIAAGKSTLARELGDALGNGTLTLLEPDESSDNPYLSDYYDDPARWSYTMQTHLLTLRYRMHLHAQWHAMQGYGHAVLDRSLMGDTAFARLQLKLGAMSEREFETYRSLYHAMTATVLLPTICLRVLVSPEESAKRIAKRYEAREGRACEKAIDLEYLKKLDTEIDHMVSVLRQQGVAVLDVPWDTERDTRETRASSVEYLARRVEALEPVDLFLDLHRRTI